MTQKTQNKTGFKPNNISNKRRYFLKHNSDTMAEETPGKGHQRGPSMHKAWLESTGVPFATPGHGGDSGAHRSWGQMSREGKHSMGSSGDRLACPAQ